MKSHYLGIEIGGTKLQVGLGPDDGRLRACWRGEVDLVAGPQGIRQQIAAAVPEVLSRAALTHSDLRAVGIGFGGPVDDSTRTVIKSHQIAGWDGFALADWVQEVVGLPAVLGNDADVAGLGEALHGAGKGLSTIFYITIGSGIGGGFILNGEIYRGLGRGAAEIGHLRVRPEDVSSTVEDHASGWGMGRRYAQSLGSSGIVTVPELISRVDQGDASAQTVFDSALQTLALAISQVIALLCPRRIVIGGGVSLLGDRLFVPLRHLVAQRVFAPFAHLTDIVPAALGEEVVLHGAIALARQRCP